MATRERAITLRDDEVRAVLGGATQHWDPIRAREFGPAATPGRWTWRDHRGHWAEHADETTLRHAPIAIGDRAWVRETWQVMEPCSDPDWRGEESIVDVPRPGRGRIAYRADEPEDVERWRSAAVMPRWASRITLEVTAVRIARIQDASEEETRAMGVDWAAPHPWGERWDDDREDPREVGYPSAGASYARDNLRRMWNYAHGRDAWERNAWCWARTFRRAPCP